MHLQRVEPVLELVLGADHLVWQLARLASGDETRLELERERRAEDEAACLGRDHDVGRERAGNLRQRPDCSFERGRVEQHRSDVLEGDPGAGEIRDVANILREVHNSSFPGRKTKYTGFAQKKGVWNSPVSTNVQS